jgi:hypothetical protein
LAERQLANVDGRAVPRAVALVELVVPEPFIPSRTPRESAGADAAAPGPPFAVAAVPEVAGVTVDAGSAVRDGEAEVVDGDRRLDIAIDISSRAVPRDPGSVAPANSGG